MKVQYLLLVPSVFPPELQHRVRVCEGLVRGSFGGLLYEVKGVSSSLESYFGVISPWAAWLSFVTVPSAC